MEIQRPLIRKTSSFLETDEDQDNYFDKILENKVKSGKSQIICSIALGILWVADGAEMQVLGFILPIIQNEWEINDFYTNAIGSSVFLMWGIAAIITGKMADKYGRRLPMLISTIGQGVTALISAFSQNYFQLFLIRAAFGFFLGLGNPLTASYISEIIPRQKRGLYICLVFLMFPVGEILTTGIAYFCLDNLQEGSWRLLLGLTAIPGLVAFILSYFYLIESPRYLLISQNEPNSKEECYKLLDHMGKLNNPSTYQELNSKQKNKLSKWADEQYLKQKNYRGNMKKVFQGNFLSLTIKSMIMWFSLSFIYYGIVFQLPTMLFKMHESQNQKSMDESLDTDFFGIFLQAVVEIPSDAVVYIFIEYPKFGRVFALRWGYIICAIACFLAYYHPNDDSYFFFLIATIKFFINVCFLVCFAFTAEIYPTSIRSSGVGLNNSVCRFGGFLMPFLSLMFYSFGNTGPLLCCGIMSIASAIAAFTISGDTRNIVLDTYVELEQVKEKNENK